MILRKPVAFLIKYFMIIHVVLTTLMIYVVTRFSSSLDYIKEYINNTAAISEASLYITTPLLISLILIIAISVAMFYLMRYKEKPKTLYILNIVLYAISFILAIILSMTFMSFSTTVVSSKDIRMVRDVVVVTKYIQYVFILIMIFRTLGFDIKKFDFVSDIQKMNIDTNDDEEIEVNIGINTNNIKTGVRRYFRELTYYYKENKTIILSIFTIVIVIIGFNIFTKVELFEKIYKEKEVVKTQNFNIQISNSYMTKKKYDGTTILDDDDVFVVVKASIGGLYNRKFKIDNNFVKLQIGKKMYTPILKYHDYFKDIGPGYSSQVLKFNEASPYLFVFQINKYEVDKTQKFIYQEGYVRNKYVEYKIKIKPTDIDKVKKEETINLTNPLDLSKTILNKGSLIINSFDINTVFGQDLDIVTAGYKKKILKLDIVSDYDYKFFDNYATIKYKVENDDKEYTLDFKNKSKINNSNIIYLEVSNKIDTATSIFIEINIRDMKYKYILK